MAGGLLRKFDLDAAWDAAVSVTATAYRVDGELISAASRGRGPRPPQAIWEAKKMAVFLVVVVSGQDYASVGRHIGLHRDTVASHCAGVRERCATDGDIETRAEALTEAALHRAAKGLPPKPPRAESEITLAARLARIEAVLGLSDGNGAHPTAAPDHANVITFPGTGGDAA